MIAIRIAPALAALSLLATLTAPAPSHAALGDCSQPATSGGGPTPTDCLAILRAAVNLPSPGCNPLCICAPGGSLPPSPTDALLCLRAATNLPAVLACPCNCDETPVPMCGGSCPDGEVCAPDPFDGGEFCDCLNACEAAEAPACSESCEGEEGTICQTIGFSTSGGPVEQICVCLPPDSQFCTDAQAPDCEGVCAPGAVCQDAGGGACACSALPQQGACSEAATPMCGGTCPGNTICTDTGGQCECQPFGQGESETCFDAEVPTCGGACAFGELCAIDIGGECECFDPCGLSQAPECGGACPDEGETCVIRTLFFGESSLDFCECIDEAQ